MSETVWLVIISAVLNGAVVWGVIRTEIKYLRRDVDRAHERMDNFEEFERRGQVHT